MKTYRYQIKPRRNHSHGLTSPAQFRRNSPIWSSSPQPVGYANPANCKSPDSYGNNFFRRFLKGKAIYDSSSRVPEFVGLPVRDKLREMLTGIQITKHRLPIVEIRALDAERSNADSRYLGISVEEARKILRFSQMEKLRAKLRDIPKSSISHSEFLDLCIETIGNEVQGKEVAVVLDESGIVIVLGNVVFLRPEHVARSVGNIISEQMASPNDKRTKELEAMEKQKAMIDRKARAQVRVELYCGLGLLLGQTLGLMRLTFWELSWDVMEPICFFITSFNFALGYLFFIRTSSEPSFEAFFRRRFNAKQEKLMYNYNFDLAKYSGLREICCPAQNNLKK